MSKKIPIFFLVMLIIFFGTASIRTLERITAHHKAIEGLKHTFIRERTSSGRVNIHLIEADRGKFRTKIRLAHNKIGCVSTLSEIAKSRPKTLAAINGTFFAFGSNLPISTIMIDGKIVFINTYNRATCGICGITENNEVFFGIPKIRGLLNIENSKNGPVRPPAGPFVFWRMNRPRTTDDITVYTSAYGNKTRTSTFGKEIVVVNNKVVGIGKGNSSIPINGFVISLCGKSKNIAKYFPLKTGASLTYTLEGKWKNARQIFTGGPRLLKEGKIVVKQSVKEEKFSGYLLSRNPRTAIGISKSGRMMLVVIDGRQRSSAGVTFYELAHIMSNLGAVEAMALDGGNSSMMWFNGKIVNSPSGGGRYIPNAIVIVPK